MIKLSVFLALAIPFFLFGALLGYRRELETQRQLLNRVVDLKSQELELEALRESKQNQEAGIKNQETAEPSSDRSTVDTSDWKTYRNEKYGFEFQYPPATNLKEEIFTSNENPPFAVRIWLGSIVINLANRRIVSKENSLSCEAELQKCSEFYYAAQGGFWGKRGVVKGADTANRLEIYGYFQFDARDFSNEQTLTDKILENLVKQNKVSADNGEILNSFNGIFSSLKFTK